MEIETLLSAAVAAPNHRLTQPWRFYVLEPDARQACGVNIGEPAEFPAPKKREPAATFTTWTT